MMNTDEATAAKIGQAFFTLVMISRALGHSDLISTARDYLAPHDVPRTPERQFVLDAIINGPDALISDSMLTEYLESADLPPI
jgi:hypothetical protein